MSNPSTASDEPWIWAIVGLLVVALGGAEWVLPQGNESWAPLPEATADHADATVRNVYGLTPVDIALVADWLVTSANDDTRYVVAGYPGSERLNGPLLTQSTVDRQMAREPDDDRLVGRPIEAGWRQVTVEGREDRRRRPLLSGARVYTESDGERRNCPRLQLERFACDSPGWAHVRQKSLQIGGSHASCIWSHPLEGRRTVVDYGPIDARSDGPPYRVRTALADAVAEERGDVDVDIRVGDRTIEHRNPASKGWHEAPPLELEGAEPLSIAISAERVGRRHFCFVIE